MTHTERMVDAIISKGWSWFKQFMGLVALGMMIQFQST